MVDQNKSFAAPLDPERINELSRAFWNSAILRAGIKLGLFALLDKGGMAATPAWATGLAKRWRAGSKRLDSATPEWRLCPLTWL